LSLEESQRPKKQDIIVIDSDSDEIEEEEEDDEKRFQADLQRALEASKVLSQSPSVPQPPATEQTSEQPKPAPSSFLSERARLEKERLERQKRLRGEAGLEDMKTAKDGPDSETESDTSLDGPPAKKQQLSRPSQEMAVPLNLAGTSRSFSSNMFWNGELRQTATRFAEPRKDGQPTFRLSQVLGNVNKLTSRY
jgi:tyrosyl-DNA phosphodiesterase-1